MLTLACDVASTAANKEAGKELGFFLQRRLLLPPASWLAVAVRGVTRLGGLLGVRFGISRSLLGVRLEILGLFQLFV